MRTELAMAGQPVMIRAIQPEGGQELQMGNVSDMDAEAVAMMMDYLSPIRLTKMDKLATKERSSAKKKWQSPPRSSNL